MSLLNWQAAGQAGALGVQLHTVRDQLGGDFARVFDEIAAIGYRELEFAGFFGQTQQAIRAALTASGLSAPSAHIDFNDLPANLPRLLADAHALGHRYLVVPWIDEAIRHRADGWQSVAETLNRAGEIAAQAGVSLAYHHHHFEFIPAANGVTPFELLLRETDPRYVQFELDLCWLAVGRQDALQLFAAHPNRFPLIHLKQIKQQHPLTESFGGMLDDLADVGPGLVEWPPLFARFADAGVKHLFVEQDQPTDSMQSIRNSFSYLANH